MTEHINLNNDWKYQTAFRPEMTGRTYDESRMETVRLPHTNVITPYNYFDERIYQFVSCYRKHIKVKPEWKNKQVLLTFEGVGHVARVYLNDVLVTSHYGGYTAFMADLAPYLDFSEANKTTLEMVDHILAVEVDSRESSNLPPFGNVIDYLTYGGIYREVYLDIKEAESIEDAFITTKDIQGSPDLKKVELKVTFHGISRHPSQENEKQCQQDELASQFTGHELKYSILDQENKTIFSDVREVMQPVLELDFTVSGVKDWDIDQPILYQLVLELNENEYAENTRQGKAEAIRNPGKTEKRNNLLDTTSIRFGFRTCEFKEDGFYLNQRKRKLVGLNRHQSFPYVGYAMPKRMQQRDAEILKQELGVNAVRTSHYPQSKHFINRCDELGLLVFTEIPGWQHIGDDCWKEIACIHVKEMVLQYRNHPSIILWGVRINESQDDEAFYKETNRIAHELDSSRQTGGVRYLKKSQLLEDVYTYNDFLHNGKTKGLDQKKDVTSKPFPPYLITEFNGHMYPTKAFDNEEHRLQHALRHASVLDALFEQEDIAGGFGWCMFDYNTHKDFGSGDRICYHGVLDMFRNPKLAAAVYASQSDEEDIFELSSSLDIGEHPAGNINTVYAFTNADSIKLYRNDTFIKEFYSSKTKYHHLPHQPIHIDDFVGDLLEKEERFSHKSAEKMKKILYAVKQYGPNHLPLNYQLQMAWLMLKEHLTLEDGTRLYYKYIGSWGGTVTAFRFEAVKNNKVVKVINKTPAGKPNLAINVKNTRLQETETYDVADIRITAVDENGNRLPFYQEPVMLETWGSVELIGPSQVSLKGGAAGAYVRTKGVSGDGGLRIIQADLGAKEIRFQVD